LGLCPNDRRIDGDPFHVGIIRPRQPQNRVEKPPPIATRPALAFATARHKLTQNRPLIVSKYLA
jgi:hypothetical protein